LLLAVALSIVSLGTSSALAGPIADKLGIYLPTDGSNCAPNDIELAGACVPLLTMISIEFDLVHLGVVELTRPDDLPNAKAYIERKYTEVLQVYRVEIDEFDDPLIKLVDGSALEKTSSGYVGYVGYHEEAILYQQFSSWKLCLNGSTYSVDWLKDGGAHYSRSSMQLTLAEIEKLEECD